uniref:FAD/NAD(P)-binding domain-containing protein n=1 Tax=Physcomitrium patens TaxID=3218 RepID=A0A2K1JJF7_PHYPA|nr:hypothetical protein PHYPA_019087 [Physcomitrium patens]
MYHEAQHQLLRFIIGVRVGSVSIDLPAMMRQKDEALTGLSKGTHTGSAVKDLPGITIDEEKVVSFTEALKLKEVSEKLVVTGGGYIGLEMGSDWGSSLGSHVTAVEFGAAIVPSMAAQVRKSFQHSLEKQKLKSELKTKLHAQGGSPSTLEVNIVLVAAERTRFTEGLGIENLGVKVDEFGRVEGIHAIGDVIPGPMFAHKAEEDGVACVELLAGKAGQVNYDTVPGVVYTHSEVASVGKTEEQSQETDKNLGVHIMGPSAGELIHEAVLAMEHGASSEDICSCLPWSSYFE